MKGCAYTMRATPDKVELMLNGDFRTIDSCLDSILYEQIIAVIATVKSGIKDPVIISKIKSLKNDTRYFSSCGYTLGEFSTAALDILGVESYVGDSEIIIKLINSKFDFF